MDSALVSKCLDAVDKNDFTDVTRGDFERALNDLAKELMMKSRTGRSFPQSYNDALDTRRGRQLYKGYCQAPAVN